MHCCIEHQDKKLITSDRTEQREYQLRELPREDYHPQLQGPPISRRALLTTSVKEATDKSVAATFEEKEATQGEMNMSTRVDQLATLMAQIVHRQEEHWQREEEHRREQEQYQEEYHRKR